jgi:hypothetical protein
VDGLANDGPSGHEADGDDEVWLNRMFVRLWVDAIYYFAMLSLFFKNEFVTLYIKTERVLDFLWG